MNHIATREHTRATAVAPSRQAAAGHRLRRRCGAALLGFGLACAGAQAGEPFSLLPPPQNINCENTPFGMTAPLIRDIEPFYFMRGTGGQTLAEYRPPAPWEEGLLHQVYQANLIQPGVTNRTWRHTIAADLNGDGRDELVAVFSDGGDVRVVVYERAAGLEPTANVIDQWSYTENVVAESIDIRAGDFDGSTDDKQELALSWQTGNTTRVVFLTGSSNGGIAQADGATAGNWTAPTLSDIRPRLASGDFLLDGRDQVMLVGVINNGGDNLFNPTLLTLDLVEFQTPWPASVLERRPGSTGGIGSKRFSNVVATLEREPGIPGPSSGREFHRADALHAHGADLVDSAAAELVVHVEFQVRRGDAQFGERVRGLAMRLFHLDTVRAADHAITAISLGNNNQHDDSRILAAYTPYRFGVVPPAPVIDTMLADVDGLPPLEIATLEAGRVPVDNFGNEDEGPLRWQAHHAYVRPGSGFSYKNEGVGPGGRRVSFKAITNGEIQSYLWNFGSGVPSSTERNPIRDFPETPATRTVRLTVTDRYGETASHDMSVTIGGTAQGSREPPYVYGLKANPVYRGRDESTIFQSPGSGLPVPLARIAAGDIDNDGFPEVLTFSRNHLGQVHRHVWRLENVADGSFGFGKLTEPMPGLAALGIVTSDFDGNSVRASLGVDCRRVTDRVARTLTWIPPYFMGLQSGADKYASFGTSTSGGTSEESRSGSYFSHSISGWIGLTSEYTLFGTPVAESSFKISVGHNWQSAKGRFTSSESEYSINQAMSVQDGGGLIQYESHQSECYSYDVANSEGPIPGSALRMCEALSAGRSFSQENAVDWNRTPGAAPLHWVPMVRDWASLALFRPVTASNVITFAPGKGADKATDGLFSTSAESAFATTRPWLEIDLGSVRDIATIRVFPTIHQRKHLRGYRIYASETPFAGSGVPSGANVREFRQNTGDTESSYSTWNLWTRNSANPETMLRARYLRLQHPGNGAVELHIAEIQVFGDTVQEPPTYPDAVCDPAVGDGHFLARVWDAGTGNFRNIEVRGDLIWTGSDNVRLPNDPPGTPFLSTGVTIPGVGHCAHGMDNEAINSERTVAQYEIWRDWAIGGNASGTSAWSLSSNTATTAGNYTSMDSSTHVGTEFEAAAGLGTMLVVGASYEFSYGATRDHQSSLTWGSGLDIGGWVGGFSDQSLRETCKYFPRPYAYNLREYSNTGFAHDLYVTDYTVRHGGRTDAWQRSNVPPACLGGTASDSIFANGFDP